MQQAVDPTAVQIPTTTQSRSLAMVQTRTVVGVDAVPVVVEVHLANGLPAFSTVGLPETAVKEAKDRVRGAIINAGFEFPAKRITVNLSPADLPKAGSRFDLPIAIGILAASGQIPSDQLHGFEFIGELALDGQLRRVAGVLPTALACGSTDKQLIVPAENAGEASLAGSRSALSALHLNTVCGHMAGQQELEQCTQKDTSESTALGIDLADVHGQHQAKRALEIAAAGGHSLLFIGPPGTGKSMLASRLPSILPPLSNQQALEAAAVQSVASGEFNVAHWRHRPFRQPHHSSSAVALVGGGPTPKPGEISLAHHGILFLDELTEFSRATLEQLREPMETGVIHIARARESVQFPAQFQLLAACNPCRCGYLGDGTDRCQCTATSIDSYRGKLSGPLLDRIDMHVSVQRVSAEDLQQSQTNQESSKRVRVRVIAARKIQQTRQSKLNSELSGKDFEYFCELDSTSRAFFKLAADRLHLSARAYHRTLRLARTIADLDSKAQIKQTHLSEAIAYRQLDRSR